MAVRSAILTVMIRAAEKAARGLVRDFGEVEQLQVSRKGPADFVSQADMKSEKTIHEELSKARPDYGFMGEETSQVKPDKEYVWVVDPLDGTTNFLHGIPHWAISIALLKGDDVVAGLVFEPLRDEMFWAEKGTGAFLNSKRLRVSVREKLDNCLLATGIPFKGCAKGNFAEDMDKIMMKVAGIRRQGAATLDLAYVAAGRYDGFWERGLQPWDTAAGCLLVKEAGGQISPFIEGQNPYMGADLLASNFHMHKELAAILGATPKVI